MCFSADAAAFPSTFTQGQQCLKATQGMLHSHIQVHSASWMQGQEKMSKSDPNSAIFMEDSAADVKTKIKKAFCEPKMVSSGRLGCMPWFCQCICQHGFTSVSVLAFVTAYDRYHLTLSESIFVHSDKQGTLLTMISNAQKGVKQPGATCTLQRRVLHKTSCSSLLLSVCLYLLLLKHTQGM